MFYSDEFWALLILLQAFKICQNTKKTRRAINTFFRRAPSGCFVNRLEFTENDTILLIKAKVACDVRCPVILPCGLLVGVSSKRIRNRTLGLYCQRLVDLKIDLKRSTPKSFLGDLQVSSLCRTDFSLYLIAVTS